MTTFAPTSPSSYFPPLSAGDGYDYDMLNRWLQSKLSGAVVTGDVVSANWDGGRDLSGGLDATATTGFFFDSSEGSAQFEGNLYIGATTTLQGTLTLDTGPGVAFRTATSGSRIEMFGSNTGAERIEFYTGTEGEQSPASIRILSAYDGVSDYYGYLSISAPDWDTPAGVPTMWFQSGSANIDRRIAVFDFDTFDLVAADNTLRGVDSVGSIVNWSIGNTTGTDNLLITAEVNANIYMRAYNGTAIKNRFLIDGNGDIVFYNDQEVSIMRMQTDAETDQARFYGSDGSTVMHQIHKDGHLSSRHPDSASLTESWPYGSIRNAGNWEGATTTMTTTEASLWSSTLTVTANEPVNCLMWWRLRIESNALQYYWARAYIGGTEVEINGGAPPIVDTGTGSQSANHTHTGPSHYHTHSGTHRHQGASDVDVYGTSSFDSSHSHSSGSYTTDSSTLLTTFVSPGDSDSSGTGNTGSNSASHTHASGFYTHLSGMAFRSYTPTGTTVAFALYGRSETSSVSVRGAAMYLIWRT